MTTRNTLVTAGLAVLMAGFVSLNYSQAPISAQPSTAAQNVQKANEGQNSEMHFDGLLSKVDTSAKTISVVGFNEKDRATDTSVMSFKYDDHTEIVGDDQTAQGLDGKTGSQLKITYHSDQGTNLATRIDVTEKPLHIFN